MGIRGWYLRDLVGVVLGRLLEHGICPGGSGYLEKNYRDGRGHNAAWRDWFECYDWRQGAPVSVANPTPDQGVHLARMRSVLVNSVMYQLFPHMARTLEGLGQGVVSYRPFNDPSSALVDTTEAVIRQLGARWLHSYETARYFPGTRDDLRGHSSRYIKAASQADRDVQQQLLASGAAKPSEAGLVFDPDGLNQSQGETRRGAGVGW